MSAHRPLRGPHPPAAARQAAARLRRLAAALAAPDLRPAGLSGYRAGRLR